MRLVLASSSPRRAEILVRLGFDVRVHPSDVDEAVLPGETPEAHAERLSREKALAVCERLRSGPENGEGAGPPRHEGVASGPRGHQSVPSPDDASPRLGDEWVLGGDTVVVMESAILGKPRSAAEAVEMLLRLQGRTHRVVSSLTLVPSPVAHHPVGAAGAGAAGTDRGAPDPPGETPRIVSGIEVTRVSFRAFGRDLAEAYARTGEPMDKAGAYGIQGLGAVLVERIEGDYTGVVGLPVPLLLRLLEDAGRPYTFPPVPGAGGRASSGESPDSNLTSDRSGR